MARVWVVGQLKGIAPWQLRGVFDVESKAIAACRDENYYMWPVMLNDAFPAEKARAIVFPRRPELIHNPIPERIETGWWRGRCNRHRAVPGRIRWR